MSLRERWPNTTLFIFAAVGSAVGLGNIWRFPYLVGKYGGGAFLFPYLLALFVIGFPLLIMEFSMGQFFQKGAVDSWRHIHRRCSGIGVGQLLTSLGICSYYGVVMGWCAIYMAASFWLPWEGDSKAFFHDQVLQISSGPLTIEGFSLPVLAGVAAVWIAVYFCIFKGVESVSAVVSVTMPLPIILLIVLLIRAVTLPGSYDGLAFFLTPKFEALTDPDVWLAAVSQVFFTLTLGLGVMITYASYQNKTSNVVRSALITAIADISIAFTAGLVIFATIGYMSHTGQGEIADLAASGPGLAFVVFPQALSLIPYAAFFSFLFFLMLITLGIDSLFSMTEAIATFFYDAFPSLSKKKVVFFVCLACFIFGLVFTTSAGIYYLDITDHFITNYALAMMGLLQSLAFGWIYGPETMRKQIAQVSKLPFGRLFDITMKYIIPLSLAGILIQAFSNDISRSYEEYPQWAIAAFGWGWVAFIYFTSLAYSLFEEKRS